MTLAVLGLDAADLPLVERFECQNLLLTESRALESFVHSRDTPLTSEVWPVIATGEMPRNGTGGRRGSDWEGVMGFIDRLAKLTVPKSTRNTVGRYLRLARPGAEMFGEVSGDHVFADGAVYNWPGLTPTQTWKQAEHWLQRYHEGTIDDLDFLRRQLAFTGQEIGWLASMSQAGFPIVGVHSHILDHAGHVWASQPDKLEAVYEHVDRLAGLLLDHPPVSELVVVSDHGMQTAVTEDEAPGHHRLEGMISASFESDLPGHVKDVRRWLERHVGSADPVGSFWNGRTFDAPVDHLRELGYLD